MNKRLVAGTLLVLNAGLAPAQATVAHMGDLSEGGQDGFSCAELDRMLAPLGSDSVDDRRAAALAVGALGPEAVGAVTQKLAQLRRENDAGVSAVIRGLRELAPRAASFELVDVLVVLHPEPAVERALTLACLARVLFNDGTTPAVRQMILVASDADGALRPELARQFKVLGDRAVPALIEARRDPSPDARLWAANLLEALGKRTPGDAVQTKDNQVLADALRAYASVKDLDALPVILSFVNTDRAQVRTAAREATLAFGQDAVWRLREAFAALTGEPAPEGTSVPDLAKKLFDAYDRYRLQDVYALVDHGLAAQREGKLDVAIADFDQALARQPLLDRRAEMAPSYLAYAESREPADEGAALAYLRKALRVDDGSPTSDHIRSEIKYLEGEDLVRRGIDDTLPFEQALALDPQNSRARAELTRLEADAESSRVRGWRLAAAGTVLTVALATIVFLGGRRVRKNSLS